jgi:hypothetical protein
MKKMIAAVVAATAMTFGAVAGALAGDTGTLTIVNNSSHGMYYYVSLINCNDAPNEGLIGPVPPHGSLALQYARTDGHGCNGHQGEFQIKPLFGGVGTDQYQQFTYDSGAGIALEGTQPVYGSQLTGTSDQHKTWTVTPTI